MSKNSSSEPKSSLDLESAVKTIPFRKILIALDLSGQAARILYVSSYLASKSNAQILACNVSQVRTGFAANELDGSPANQEERDTLDKLKELIHESFGSAAESIEVKILHGDPAERITEYAEYSDSDLIIMGSRGQGALKKALVGSVSSSVFGKTKKSILVVK
ncbi:MAG: universal stress protein [Nitrososphaerales archaeon]